MLATFGNTTLADDTNSAGQGKFAFVLNDFGFDSVVMITPGYGATAPIKIPLGNVDAKISFIATRSFADLDTMLAFLKAVYALINTVDKLILKQGATSITDTQAKLKSARKYEVIGTRLGIIYNFELTTIT